MNLWSEWIDHLFEDYKLRKSAGITLNATMHFSPLHRTKKYMKKIRAIVYKIPSRNAG